MSHFCPLDPAPETRAGSAMGPIDCSQPARESSSLLLFSLELSDAEVCEAYIRALMETAAHFCEVVVDSLTVWLAFPQ